MKTYHIDTFVDLIKKARFETGSEYLGKDTPGDVEYSRIITEDKYTSIEYNYADISDGESIEVSQMREDTEDDSYYHKAHVKLKGFKVIDEDGELLCNDDIVFMLECYAPGVIHG